MTNKTPKLRVLGYRVLIQIENDEISPGGVIKPELSEPDRKRGVVVALGDGTVNDTGRVLEFPVRVGDKVVLGPFAVTDYVEDGTLYCLVAAQDIFGVLP
jgi:chaperonin GroES